jgi:hypothetical protein
VAPRRGQKLIPDSERKNHLVAVRLTEEEYQALEAFCAGETTRSICAGRSGLHNQALLEITHRWEAGLPVALTTDKPWPHILTRRT